jgi:hypothetical protein
MNSNNNHRFFLTVAGNDLVWSQPPRLLLPLASSSSHHLLTNNNTFRKKILQSIINTVAPNDGLQPSPQAAANLSSNNIIQRSAARVGTIDCILLNC